MRVWVSCTALASICGSPPLQKIQAEYSLRHIEVAHFDINILSLKTSSNVCAVAAGFCALFLTDMPQLVEVSGLDGFALAHRIKLNAFLSGTETQKKGRLRASSSVTSLRKTLVKMQG